MDKQMFIPVICCHVTSIITGVSGCSLYGLVPEKPRSDNSDLTRLFLFYLFDRCFIYKQTGDEFKGFG